MASIADRLGDIVGKTFLDELVVERAERLSTHFRELDLRSEALVGRASAPGDKVQLMLGLAFRTYTPFAFDARTGRFSLLVFVHGDTPGAQWGAEVTEGAQVRMFGPRGSLPLASMTGPLVLVGDETSLGVARALREHRRDTDALAFVFESRHPDEARAVIERYALPSATLVPSEQGDAHLPALASALRASLEARPDARLVLTGKAQTIRALRDAIRKEAIPHAGQKVKAYWAPGKRGLD